MAQSIPRDTQVVFDEEGAYYHVTLLQNVPSIRKYGLIPQIGELSKAFGESEEGVFLFPSYQDMDTALMNWFGAWYDDEYGEDCKLAVLKIHLPPDAQLCNSEAAYEKLCKSIIPPECIAFFDELGNEIPRGGNIMTDYPYDFGTGYKVQTVFANKTKDGIYGDIYDFRSDVEREHPGAEILTGYCVIDVGLGLVPDGCNDWNDTVSDAILDYEEHVVLSLERKQNNVVKALIAAMVDYGMDSCWNDSDIIDALMDVGVTQEDFQKAGYENFVKEYFADEELPILNNEKPKKIVNGTEKQNTRRLNVTVSCQAVYNSGIDVPIGLSLDESIAYAKEHIRGIPRGSLDYVPCSDEIDVENCDFDDHLMAVDIEWDVDNEEDRASLPTEIEIPFGMEDIDEISDYLSDVTGFCHKGYNLVVCEDHFAKKTLEDKPSLSAQIQSASSRAAETPAGNVINIKNLCDAYNRSDLEALLYLKDFCSGNNSRFIEDLINANLNFYEGYSRKTSIKNEAEYHDKKWELFKSFGVTRNFDDQMIPSIVGTPHR